MWALLSSKAKTDFGAASILFADSALAQPLGVRLLQSYV